MLRDRGAKPEPCMVERDGKREQKAAGVVVVAAALDDLDAERSNEFSVVDRDVAAGDVRRVRDIELLYALETPARPRLGSVHDRWRIPNPQCCSDPDWEALVRRSND